jgi:uncharacterized protein (DUF58 family)
VTAPRADLADPAALAALGDLEIVSRWVVDGFLTGLHRSPRRGFSVEFAEHRPYQPGDDPRYLDWRIAARADRWVIKQFEEDSNLRAALVLDVSPSMAWTGAPSASRGAPARLTKRAYAERLVAALALLLLRQHDAVGLVRFDDRVLSTVPPRARGGQWRRVLAALAEPDPPRERPLLDSAPADALERAGQLVPRAGLVVLVSDLLADAAPALDALRTLRGAGHDVAVVHVLDPAERELPAALGDAEFEDPETGYRVSAASADVRDAYRAAVDSALTEWRDGCARLGARYALVSTDEPFGGPLRRAFAARAALP